MKSKILKWLREPQVWGFFVSVAVLAAVSLAFFAPDNFDGNSLRQADMQQGAANGQEAKAFREATGEQALWTDALFGGMPTFQISPEYPSNSLFTWLNSVYGLGLPAPSNLLFMMMVGFLILLFAMKMRWYYALIGAMAWGFSSYFVIIIGAGHIWKFVALSYVPPTIAGLVLTYRGRYIAGGAMTALFAMLQLNANHPQMSYYFAFVMLALVIAWGHEALKQRAMRRWLIASAVTIVCGGLAVGANLPSLYNTYEYSKETKRSQSELTPLPSATGTPAERPTGGMPYSQIVGWSYGKAETFSLLVPNVKGGATAKPEGGGMVHLGLDRLDDAKNYPDATLLPYCTQYFNNSEGTNGPVYVGAVICALFLLGCIIVKGPVKRALVVMTVLSILLAWGENFTTLTDMFIFNFPLYNKFRAVESILVIAEFTMPLLAVMALYQLLTTPDALTRYRKPVFIAFGICAAVCLIGWLAPGIFGSAINDNDRAVEANIASQVAAMAQQSGASASDVQAYIYQYSLANPANSQAIESLRYGLVKSDCGRSLAFIAIAATLLLACMYGKMQRRWAIVGIGMLTLFDLYGVDKRYVDHASFVAVKAGETEFTPDAIDNLILQDTTHYRVMDIPGFTSPNRSYFHCTVGGYHAAKLNRYEDLIQRHLMTVASAGYFPELREDSVIAQYTADQQVNLRRLQAAYRVLDMLDAKYIITGDADAPVVANTHALGNAWLVDNISYVDNADAEMAALSTLDPGTQAVADRRFEAVLGKASGTLAAGDTIVMTGYTPNTVTYRSRSHTDAIGVFSEVWFPWGWKATVDGKEAQIGRVDYILRALALPAGEHEIVMTFDPESIHVTEGIAYASVSIIYLLLALALVVEYRRRTGKSADNGAVSEL